MTKINPKNELAVQKTGLMVGDAPDFMREFRDDGAELLKQYVIPPRIKIVQPMSKKPLSELFREGDAVALPMMQQIAEYDRDERMPAFFFTPILFYPEWIAWNPMDSKGKIPATRGRTLDPRHPIAAKAKDERLRESEVCPEFPKNERGQPCYVKYLEHLTFIIKILPPHPLAELPITVSYSSGEHRYGSNFITMMQLRKAPLYGCNFQAVIRERDNGKGRWFGIDVENPHADSGVSAFVQDREQFDSNQRIWREYDALLKEKLIQVDYETTGEDVVESETPANTNRM